MQGILILIAVIIGFILRDLTINRIKQRTERAYKRIRGNKSSLVSWTPEKSGNEQAQEQVKANLGGASGAGAAPLK